MKREASVVGPSPRIGRLGVVPGALEFDLAEVIGVAAAVPLAEDPPDGGRGAGPVLVFSLV
ncbi:hypothetical protein C478_03827 [Natrinema thermotolerans DSM 11552]|nr:hypothetical protein C478_03827 [Natrinema thermotolerans DSM 11552]